MMKFLGGRSHDEDTPAPANTVIGLGSALRGTLMVSGTLKIDGEFEGDILNCDRLEIGEHGIMRADVEVKEAVVKGRVLGNIRALGNIEMKSGARVEGDVAAVSVAMDPGVYFSGRCTMLDTGFESVELGAAQGGLQRGGPAPGGASRSGSLLGGPAAGGMARGISSPGGSATGGGTYGGSAPGGSPPGGPSYGGSSYGRPAPDRQAGH